MKLSARSVVMITKNYENEAQVENIPLKLTKKIISDLGLMPSKEP